MDDKILLTMFLFVALQKIVSPYTTFKRRHPTCSPWKQPLLLSLMKSSKYFHLFNLQNNDRCIFTHCCCNVGWIYWKSLWEGSTLPYHHHRWIKCSSFVQILVVCFFFFYLSQVEYVLWHHYLLSSKAVHFTFASSCCSWQSSRFVLKFNKAFCNADCIFSSSNTDWSSSYHYAKKM